MALVHPFTSNEILKCIRTRDAKALADNMIGVSGYCVRSYGWSKASPTLHPGQTQEDRIKKHLTFNNTILSTIFQLNDEIMCQEVKNLIDKYPLKELPKLDHSGWVMALLKDDPSAFFWGIEQGWAEYIPLQKERCAEMDWKKVQYAALLCKNNNGYELLDTWLRTWTSKDPTLMEQLHAPTKEDCRYMVMHGMPITDTILEVLQNNYPALKEVISASTALGLWHHKTSQEDKAALIIQACQWDVKAENNMTLPDNMQMEP